MTQNVLPRKLNYLRAVFIGLILFMGSVANAGFIPNPATCNVTNATLTSIQTTDGLPPSGELLTQSYSATSCVGVYPGNDNAGGLSNPSPNIGQLGDGLLNGQDIFDGLEFILPSDLQDLDGDGDSDDPGWIHLAGFEADSAGINYSTIGPVAVGGPSLDIGDLLTFSLVCTSKDDTGAEETLADCSMLNWTLTTKLGIIADVQALLGPATFDHLAFSIKAGNENSNGGGGFAVYDFNFKTIFDNENDPKLNFYTPYKLSGTLSTGDFGLKGFSHINLWARDPADVPEPGTLALFALGLAGLGVIRRKRYKHN